MKNDFIHKPVLLKEVLEAFSYLKDKKDPLFVDGTVGLAGHSVAIAQKITEDYLAGVKTHLRGASETNVKYQIIAVDKDQEALKLAKKRIIDDGLVDHFEFVNDKFENLAEILEELKIYKADGILLDLGVSSMQLDDGERGFSFQAESEIDMRMDQNQPLTAKEVINKYAEKELVRIFSEYGEERFSKTIARKIVELRSKEAINTTKELAQIVASAVPSKFRSSKTSPATNVFRALRMEVNREVADLEDGIGSIVTTLNSGGKLAVISFHSIEDRIVKQTLNKLANPCICPPKMPVCSCGLSPQIKILNKKPLVASEKELEENPRARSAKMRVVERV